MEDKRKRVIKGGRHSGKLHETSKQIRSPQIFYLFRVDGYESFEASEKRYSLANKRCRKGNVICRKGETKYHTQTFKLILRLCKLIECNAIFEILPSAKSASAGGRK